MFQDQNAGQNYNIRKGNRSFKRVKQFRYLGTTLTNQTASMKKLKNSSQGMLSLIQ
jgi:hypothetical protein